MKKALVLGVALTLCWVFGLAGGTLAEEKGPADMTLESTVDPAKKAKPAIFPHAAHQERLKCADCHHSKGDDGKQVVYADGQKIEKCESCHNSKAGLPKKLATFKGAAHALCKDCHTKTDKAKLAKCTVCHPKK